MQIKALENGVKDIVSKGKKKTKKGFESSLIMEVKRKKKEIEEKI